MVTPTKSSSRNSVGFFKAPLPISEIVSFKNSKHNSPNLKV